MDPRSALQIRHRRRQRLVQRGGLGEVPQGVFVANDHPLARPEDVQRKDLVKYRQLVMRAEDVREATVSPRLWRSDSFYSIAEMVADDLGWAILPVNIGTDDAYDKPLQQVPLVGAVEGLKYE